MAADNTQETEEAPAPPKRRPERVCFAKANPSKAKDKTYKGHTGAPITVKASQDGKFVVTGGVDRRLVVYNAADLTPIRAFTQHRDIITGLAFRRGTNQLFSCSKDRTVKVWSLDELAYVETLFGHQDEILGCRRTRPRALRERRRRDRTARYWKVPEESQLVFRGGSGEGGSSKKHKIPANIDPASAAHEGSMERVAMIDDEIFVTRQRQRRPRAVEHPAQEGAARRPARPRHRAAPAAVRGVGRRGPRPERHPRPAAAGYHRPADDPLLGRDPERQLGRVRPRVAAERGQAEDRGRVCAGRCAGIHNSHDQWGTQGQGEGKAQENGGLVRGIVNDIAMFERGERGRDGLCVVAVTGKEMRLGRWKNIKEGRCGAVIFECPSWILKKKAEDDGDDANGIFGESESDD